MMLLNPFISFPTQQGSVGTAAGVSTAEAVGESTFAAIAAAAGVASASGVGASVAESVGSAAGTSTADGVSQPPGEAVGSAAGTSTAAAVGESTAAATASAAGTGAASGVGASTAEAAGAAAGTSAASGVGHPNFANVVFLVSFDGVDEATTATDDSNSAHTLTFNRTAKLDDAVPPAFGTTMLFPNGGYVSAPDSADFWLMQDASTRIPFCVEGFIYKGTDNNDFQLLIGQWDTAANQKSWALWHNTSSTNDRLEASFSVNGSTSLFDIAGDWTGSGVQHVALDFDGTKYRLFLAGVMIGSSTTMRNLHNSTGKLTLGDQDGGSAVDPFTGRSHEWRITRASLYGSDSSFTPPNAPFPRA